MLLHGNLKHLPDKARIFFTISSRAWPCLWKFPYINKETWNIYLIKQEYFSQSHPEPGHACGNFLPEIFISLEYKVNNTSDAFRYLLISFTLSLVKNSVVESATDWYFFYSDRAGVKCFGSDSLIFSRQQNCVQHKSVHDLKIIHLQIAVNATVYKSNAWNTDKL
jgi:hypothetical protein